MIPALAIIPESSYFPASREEEFITALGDQDRYTVCQPLSSLREVALDGQGRTVHNGEQLTTLALYQICQVACPGMYQFVNELSGVNRLDDTIREDYSLSEALTIYNQVIRRRFQTRLQGRQVVRHTKDKLVAGVVGPKYRRLPNKVLYDGIKQLLSSSQKPPLFYEAVLNGWWLLLRYYKPKSMFVVDGPMGERDRFFQGYHFSNNEVGEAAVKAAAFVLRDSGRTAALCPSSSGGRVIHTGGTFNERLRRVLFGVKDRLGEPDVYRNRVLALLSTNLQLGNGQAEPGERREEELVHRLVRRDLRHTVAKDVVSSLLVQGSYDDHPVPEGIARVGRQTRTAYDLFTALGRVAKRLSISGREQAEQVAYALLVGKFRVV
jgi:hypothetical protein